MSINLSEPQSVKVATPAFVPQNSDNLIDRSQPIAWVLFAVVLVYVMGWIAVPALTSESPPLDVVESFVWSLDPQAGYYKHPPLPAWVTALAIALAGKNVWVLMSLGPVCALLTMGFLWLLARQFLDAENSMVALLLGSAQTYFTLMIPEFNHNVIQMPLWAGTIALFWITLQSGQIRHAAALGILMGLCVLAKYSAVILFAFLGYWLLVDERSRTNLRPSTIVVTLAASALVCGRNLIWQFKNDFPSAKYLQERVGETLGGTDRIISAAEFLLVQSLTLLPLVIVAIVTATSTKAQASPRAASYRRAQHYLLASFLFPVALTVSISLLTGKPLKHMWGMPMLTTVGIALVACWPDKFLRLFKPRWLIIWVSLQALFWGVYAANQFLNPQIKHALPRTMHPGTQIATVIEHSWQSETADAPLRYLVGPTWDAGVVSLFAKQTPKVLIEGDFGKSPWVNPDKLASNGAVLLWLSDKPGAADPSWIESFPDKGKKYVASVAHPKYPDLPLSLNWYVIPPAR